MAFDKLKERKTVMKKPEKENDEIEVKVKANKSKVAKTESFNDAKPNSIAILTSDTGNFSNGMIATLEKAQRDAMVIKALELRSELEGSDIANEIAIIRLEDYVEYFRSLDISKLRAKGSNILINIDKPLPKYKLHLRLGEAIEKLMFEAGYTILIVTPDESITISLALGKLLYNIKT